MGKWISPHAYMIVIKTSPGREKEAGSNKYKKKAETIN